MPIKKELPTAKEGTKARVRLDPIAQRANAKAAKRWHELAAAENLTPSGARGGSQQKRLPA